jgi:hypothetical protein
MASLPAHRRTRAASDIRGRGCRALTAGWDLGCVDWLKGEDRASEGAETGHGGKSVTSDTRGGIAGTEPRGVGCELERYEKVTA